MALGSGGGGSTGTGPGAIRAGAAFVEFFGKDNLTGLMTKLQKRFAGLSAALGKAGAAGLGAGAVLLAPVTALFKSAVDHTADMQKTADSLGLPIAQFSKLAHAAEVAGVAVEDVLKDPARFKGLIAQAPAVDEATGRKALETQREFARAMIELRLATLPLLDAVLPVVTSFAALAKEFGGVLVVAAGVGAGLVAVGAVATGASAVFGALAAAAGAVSAALGALLTTPGLVVAALAGVGYALVTQTEAGREFAGELSAGLEGVVETAKSAGAGIKDALAAGDLRLAWQVALTGLRLEWDNLVVYLTGKWNAFKGFFVDGWYDGVKLLKLAWNDFSKFMNDSITSALKFLNDKFGESFRAVLGVLANLFDKFDPEMAKHLRTIAGSSTALLGKVLDDIKKSDAKTHLANETTIENQAAAAQRARSEARLNDLNEARLRAEADALELSRLVGAAHEAAARRLPAVGAAIPQAVMKTLVRGVFSGPLAAQLGAGNQFERRLVAATEAMQRDIHDLNQRAGPLVFTLK